MSKIWGSYHGLIGAYLGFAIKPVGSALGFLVFLILIVITCLVFGVKLSIAIRRWNNERAPAVAQFATENREFMETLAHASKSTWSICDDLIKIHQKKVA